MPKRKPGSTLTNQEKMFCAAYLIDFDATQVATGMDYPKDATQFKGINATAKAVKTGGLPLPRQKNLLKPAFSSIHGGFKPSLNDAKRYL